MLYPIGMTIRLFTSISKSALQVIFIYYLKKINAAPLVCCFVVVNQNDSHLRLLSVPKQPLLLSKIEFFFDLNKSTFKYNNLHHSYSYLIEINDLYIIVPSHSKSYEALFEKRFRTVDRC